MESKQLILITGGSSGIGKHIASEYLKQGASVIIIADGKEKLQEEVLEINLDGVKNANKVQL